MLAPSTSQLWGEGLAMLAALAEDLRRNGHQTTTWLDPSIQSFASNRYPSLVDCVAELPISIQNISAFLDRWVFIAQRCDKTIVIAPELDNHLFRTIEHMRARGIELIASDFQFQQVANDKYQTSRCWRRKLPHPPTWLLSELIDAPDHLVTSGHLESGKWVVKRRHGAGGVDMQIFTSAQQMVQSLKTANAATPTSGSWTELDQWIAQPWIEGKPASAAIITGEHGIQVLGSFSQRLAPESMSYTGGSGPLNDLPDDQLAQFVQRAIELIPGVPRGWIGIDFVITSNGDWIPIELNARLTSSYLGYRRWYGPTLAESIIRGTPIPQDLVDARKTPLVFGIEEVVDSDCA